MSLKDTPIIKQIEKPRHTSTNSRKLISFQAESVIKPQAKLKIRIRPAEKPLPKRNYIKENIKNAAKLKKRSESPDYSIEIRKKSKSPEQLRDQTPSLNIIRKAKSVSPAFELPKEEQIPSLTSRLRVTNPDLLTIVFQQFADLVVLQWEEAADLLIDEILSEEAEYLNSLETQIEPVFQEDEDIVVKIEAILEDEIRLRNKYLS